MNVLAELQAVRTADFDYQLPPELIAQQPVEPRDSARLMVLCPSQGGEHVTFRDLPSYLRPGDLLVANRSRVITARLHAKLSGGRAAEVLLLRRLGEGVWEALGRPARRFKPGCKALLAGEPALIEERLEEGMLRLRFQRGASGEDRALANGRLPLPPYIKSWQGDDERYQTVYADADGSVAAPTAGLHFTPRLMDELVDRGVEVQYLTLHVGADTFRPVRSELAAEHRMHAEYFEVPAYTAQSLRRARAERRRVVAVGTTSVRVLETVSERLLSTGDSGEGDEAIGGWTRLFILPGFNFRIVDGLITNFHLPRTTLLMLVSAFAGRERILASYREAARLKYRFYSFGDATLLWR